MQEKVNSPVVIVTATTLAALVVGGVILWIQTRQKPKKIPPSEMVIPTKWTKIGEVGEVVLYPLKGGKRQSVAKAECTKVGLKLIEDPSKLAMLDRLFIVRNEKNEFVTITKITKMLFLEVSAVDKSRVKFTFPDTEDLFVQIPDQNSSLTTVQIKNGEVVKTVDCGDEAASWFSETLIKKPTGLRLGCFIENLIPPRTTDGAYEKHAQAYTKFHSEYMGSYHNVASYMLVSAASVADLNSRLDRSPVNEHYFRPNIIVNGSTAFSEDHWDWIKIGNNVVLRGFKYCIRCAIVTVDPDTAVRDPKLEPLKTLKTYRQIKEPHLRKVDGADPVMGLYAGCHTIGTIQVGDPVYINSE